MAIIKLYPSSISTVRAWTNANNALTDDSVYATTNGTRNSNHDIIGSGFDLSSIPDGSTINSVALEVKYKLSTTSSTWTGTLSAVKNGSLDNGTAITTTTEPTVNTVWRNTGTGSYTKDTLAQLEVLFRVRRSSFTSCTYSVDYLAIEVDYTVPVPETVNINVPVSIVTAQSLAPDISIKYPIMVQAPVSNATTTMLTPFRESISKLMTIDSLLNLAVLDEIVEGAVVNLDKYGVLTIVEIIEGSTFNLSSTGVLTINSVTEGVV